MSHIFISYSTKNADYAYKLADKLRDEGFDVWIDNAKLRSSDNWWESIVKALRSADVFIVIMTPESRSSQWVQREVHLAANSNKPAFPLLLAGENFDIYVLTQFKDVRDGNLPPSDFYDDLARFTQRKQQVGADVTGQAQDSPIDDSLIETHVDTKLKISSSRLIGMGLTGIVAIVALIFAISMFMNNGDNGEGLNSDATQTENATATITVASSDEPDPTIAPTATPDIISMAIGRAMNFTGTNEDWEIVTNTFEDGIEMVLVPQACFDMGSFVGDIDEQPVELQCIEAPFWIDRTEVTNAQFASLNGVVGREGFWTAENYPREQITWFEARAFCELRNARLPSELEWEYAARGIDGLNYPWGNNFNAELVNYLNVLRHPELVGRYRDNQSWVGAYDMSGNVWEWVNSIYSDYPLNDSAEDYQGINDQRSRVKRGGGWDSGEYSLRASFRSYNSPNSQFNNVGFRCVRDIESDVEMPVEPVMATNIAECRYEVQSDNNVVRIAQNNNVTISALLEANGLSESSIIQIGDFLFVPHPNCHQVSPGETLLSIANQ